MSHQGLCRLPALPVLGGPRGRGLWEERWALTPAHAQCLAAGVEGLLSSPRYLGSRVSSSWLPCGHITQAGMALHKHFSLAFGAGLPSLPLPAQQRDLGFSCRCQAGVPCRWEGRGTPAALGLVQGNSGSRVSGECPLLTAQELVCLTPACCSFPLGFLSLQPPHAPSQARPVRTGLREGPLPGELPPLAPSHPRKQEAAAGLMQGTQQRPPCLGGRSQKQTCIHSKALNPRLCSVLCGLPCEPRAGP